MKHTLISAALALGLGTAAQAAPENYSIDPSHTFSHWTLSHMGFSMQQGRFNSTSGKITLDMAAKSGSADISIDASSIDSGWAKRDEHLRGEDFFNTAKYPTLNFKSSKFQFKGDKLVPAERFDFLREQLGDAFIAVELEDADANPDARLAPHSVVTEHLIDEPGQPTRAALDQVLDLFRTRLLLADEPAG